LAHIRFIAGEGEVPRIRTLYELLAALSHASALEDVYDAAITSLLEATAADRAAILLFDEAGVIRFEASRGLSDDYQAAVTGHSPWLPGTLDAQPLVVPNVQLDARLAGCRGVLAKEGIRGLAFVPLALEAGVFGKFMLYYAEPHHCTAGELEISQAIAAHVGLAIQRKRAELASARSEQRLQAILDNSAAVIVLKDIQGRYLLVNRRYEELFHVTRAAAAGLTDRDIFPAEMADLLEANDRAALAAGKAISVEESIPHDDGVHSYISIKFPLTGPDGAVTGVGGIATDITEQKQLEIASRHLAAIVESSEDAIISKDLRGIITSWNKGAERIFGYTSAETIGQPVSMLTAADRLDEMPGILSRITQGQHIKHYETRRRRKDGQIIDVALSVSPVRDTAGRIVGASKIARDITERKHIEQERASLLIREQEARRTAELLNGVGPRLAAQLDLEKLVQEVSNIAAVLVGAECGSFCPNVSNEKGMPREMFAGLAMVCNSEILAPVFRGEGVVRCQDLMPDSREGEDAPHAGMAEHKAVRSVLAAPVIARTGEVLGGLFFGHSVPGRFTKTHEAIVTGIAAQAAIAMDNARLFEQAQWVQTELRRSNEELRRANRDLEVFAYSASHDLQEPLRTIAISAQLLERSCGPQLRGDEETFLTNILTSTRRMSGLLEDLLAYARATKYEKEQAPVVDSVRILADVLESLQGLIQEAGATVTAGPLPPVAIHGGRLAQLFQNLVGNAIKYRSEEVPHVTITAAERDGWCVFSVVDNGIGIEAEYAERIFGLFKRLHGRDKYPGNGIGLAICQRVVEQYGGRIWLEQSAPGRGSAFCFSVPSRP
jgi:PAS domain S-box-containing protein